MGISLKWDYTKCTFKLSMPGYVYAVLHCFQHPTPTCKQDSPYPWTAPAYGCSNQQLPAEHQSKPLLQFMQKEPEQLIGTFLYYARGVNPTMISALNSLLASAENKAISHTTKTTTHFLNYCASHPDATLEYQASDMILYIESNASYHSKLQAQSRAGRYFYLGHQPTYPTKPPAT